MNGLKEQIVGSPFRGENYNTHSDNVYFERGVKTKCNSKEMPLL